MHDPDVGEIVEVFRPALENLIAGLILGCLAIGGGATLIFSFFKQSIALNWQMPLHAEKGMCWLAFGLGLVLGIAVILGGIALLVWMRRLMKFHVTLGTNGLVVADRKGRQVYLWDDIQSVEEIERRDNLPVHGPLKHALPKKKSMSFTVKCWDRREFEFHGSTLRRHEKLAELLQPQLLARDIKWVTRRG